MGNCTSGTSGGAGGGRVSQSGSDFISFAPTALNKGKERVVTLADNGDYIYSRSIPSFDDINVDTNSQGYKRALRDYNIKAKFNENGTVTVTSGGLYSRKQTFKNTDAFSDDATKRIDNLKSYWSGQEQRIRSGVLTQLEAESIKSTVIKSSKSMAIKSINSGFKERISSAMNYTAAADDMKRRLNNAISKAKKR